MGVAGVGDTGRRRVAATVRIDTLAGAGTTVVLTTQYLEEADRLTHTVAVLDRGAIIASGSPEELKARLHGDRLRLRLADAGCGDVALALLREMEGVVALDCGTPSPCTTWGSSGSSR